MSLLFFPCPLKFKVKSNANNTYKISGRKTVVKKGMVTNFQIGSIGLINFLFIITSRVCFFIFHSNNVLLFEYR